MDEPVDDLIKGCLQGWFPDEKFDEVEDDVQLSGEEFKQDAIPKNVENQVPTTLISSSPGVAEVTAKSSDVTEAADSTVPGTGDANEYPEPSGIGADFDGIIYDEQEPQDEQANEVHLRSTLDEILKKEYLGFGLGQQDDFLSLEHDEARVPTVPSNADEHGSLSLSPDHPFQIYDTTIQSSSNFVFSSLLELSEADLKSTKVHEECQAEIAHGAELQAGNRLSSEQNTESPDKLVPQANVHEQQTKQRTNVEQNHTTTTKARNQAEPQMPNLYACRPVKNVVPSEEPPTLIRVGASSVPDDRNKINNGLSKKTTKKIGGTLASAAGVDLKKTVVTLDAVPEINADELLADDVIPLVERTIPSSGSDVCSCGGLVPCCLHGSTPLPVVSVGKSKPRKWKCTLSQSFNDSMRLGANELYNKTSNCENEVIVKPKVSVSGMKDSAADLPSVSPSDHVGTTSIVINKKIGGTPQKTTSSLFTQTNVKYDIVAATKDNASNNILLTMTRRRQPVASNKKITTSPKSDSATKPIVEGTTPISIMGTAYKRPKIPFSTNIAPKKRESPPNLTHENTTEGNALTSMKTSDISMENTDTQTPAVLPGSQESPSLSSTQSKVDFNNKVLENDTALLSVKEIAPSCELDHSFNAVHTNSDKITKSPPMIQRSTTDFTSHKENLIPIVETSVASKDRNQTESTVDDSELKNPDKSQLRLQALEKRMRTSSAPVTARANKHDKLVQDKTQQIAAINEPPPPEISLAIEKISVTSAVTSNLVAQKKESPQTPTIKISLPIDVLGLKTKPVKPNSDSSKSSTYRCWTGTNKANKIASASDNSSDDISLIKKTGEAPANCSKEQLEVARVTCDNTSPFPNTLVSALEENAINDMSPTCRNLISTSSSIEQEETSNQCSNQTEGTGRVEVVPLEQKCTENVAVLSSPLHEESVPGTLEKVGRSNSVVEDLPSDSNYLLFNSKEVLPSVIEISSHHDNAKPLHLQIDDCLHSHDLGGKSHQEQKETPPQKKEISNTLVLSDNYLKSTDRKTTSWLRNPKKVIPISARPRSRSSHDLLKNIGQERNMDSNDDACNGCSDLANPSIGIKVKETIDCISNASNQPCQDQYSPVSSHGSNSLVQKPESSDSLFVDYDGLRTTQSIVTEPRVTRARLTRTRKNESSTKVKKRTSKIVHKDLLPSINTENKCPQVSDVYSSRSTSIAKNALGPSLTTDCGNEMNDLNSTALKDNKVNESLVARMSSVKESPMDQCPTVNATKLSVFDFTAEDDVFNPVTTYQSRKEITTEKQSREDGGKKQKSTKNFSHKNEEGLVAENYSRKKKMPRSRDHARMEVKDTDASLECESQESKQSPRALRYKRKLNDVRFSGKGEIVVSSELSKNDDSETEKPLDQELRAKGSKLKNREKADVLEAHQKDKPFVDKNGVKTRSTIKILEQERSGVLKILPDESMYEVPANKKTSSLPLGPKIGKKSACLAQDATSSLLTNKVELPQNAFETRKHGTIIANSCDAPVSLVTPMMASGVSQMSGEPYEMHNLPQHIELEGAKGSSPKSDNSGSFVFQGESGKKSSPDLKFPAKNIYDKSCDLKQSTLSNSHVLRSRNKSRSRKPPKEECLNSIDHQSHDMIGSSCSVKAGMNVIDSKSSVPLQSAAKVAQNLFKNGDIDSADTVSSVPLNFEPNIDAVTHKRVTRSSYSKSSPCIRTSSLPVDGERRLSFDSSKEKEDECDVELSLEIASNNITTGRAMKTHSQENVELSVSNCVDNTGVDASGAKIAILKDKNMSADVTIGEKIELDSLKQGSLDKITTEAVCKMSPTSEKWMKEISDDEILDSLTDLHPSKNCDASQETIKGDVAEKNDNFASGSAKTSLPSQVQTPSHLDGPEQNEPEAVIVSSTGNISDGKLSVNAPCESAAFPNRLSSNKTHSSKKSECFLLPPKRRKLNAISQNLKSSDEKEETAVCSLSPVESLTNLESSLEKSTNSEISYPGKISTITNTSNKTPDVENSVDVPQQVPSTTPNTNIPFSINHILQKPEDPLRQPTSSHGQNTSGDSTWAPQGSPKLPNGFCNSYFLHDPTHRSRAKSSPFPQTCEENFFSSTLDPASVCTPIIGSPPSHSNQYSYTRGIPCKSGRVRRPSDALHSVIAPEAIYQNIQVNSALTTSISVNTNGGEEPSPQYSPISSEPDCSPVNMTVLSSLPNDSAAVDLNNATPSGRKKRSSPQHQLRPVQKRLGDKGGFEPSMPIPDKIHHSVVPSTGFSRTSVPSTKNLSNTIIYPSASKAKVSFTRRIKSKFETHPLKNFQKHQMRGGCSKPISDSNSQNHENIDLALLKKHQAKKGRNLETIVGEVRSWQDSCSMAKNPTLINSRNPPEPKQPTVDAFISSMKNSHIGSSCHEKRPDSLPKIIKPAKTSYARSKRRSLFETISVLSAVETSKCLHSIVASESIDTAENHLKVAQVKSTPTHLDKKPISALTIDFNSDKETQPDTFESEKKTVKQTSSNDHIIVCNTSHLDNPSLESKPEVSQTIACSDSNSEKCGTNNLVSIESLKIVNEFDESDICHDSTIYDELDVGMEVQIENSSPYRSAAASPCIETSSLLNEANEHPTEHVTVTLPSNAETIASVLGQSKVANGEPAVIVEQMEVARALSPELSSEEHEDHSTEEFEINSCTTNNSEPLNDIKLDSHNLEKDTTITNHENTEPVVERLANVEIETLNVPHSEMKDSSSTSLSPLPNLPDIDKSNLTNETFDNSLLREPSNSPYESELIIGGDPVSTEDCVATQQQQGIVEPVVAVQPVVDEPNERLSNDYVDETINQTPRKIELDSTDNEITICSLVENGLVSSKQKVPTDEKDRDFHGENCNISPADDSEISSNSETVIKPISCPALLETADTDSGCSNNETLDESVGIDKPKSTLHLVPGDDDQVNKDNSVTPKEQPEGAKKPSVMDQLSENILKIAAEEINLSPEKHELNVDGIVASNPTSHCDSLEQSQLKSIVEPEKSVGEEMVVSELLSESVEILNPQNPVEVAVSTIDSTNNHIEDVTLLSSTISVEVLPLVDNKIQTAITDDVVNEQPLENHTYSALKITSEYGSRNLPDSTPVSEEINSENTVLESAPHIVSSQEPAPSDTMVPNDNCENLNEITNGVLESEKSNLDISSHSSVCETASSVVSFSAVDPLPAKESDGGYESGDINDESTIPSQFTPSVDLVDPIKDTADDPEEEKIQTINNLGVVDPVDDSSNNQPMCIPSAPLDGISDDKAEQTVPTPALVQNIPNQEISSEKDRHVSVDQRSGFVEDDAKQSEPDSSNALEPSDITVNLDSSHRENSILAEAQLLDPLVAESSPKSSQLQSEIATTEVLEKHVDSDVGENETLKDAPISVLFEALPLTLEVERPLKTLSGGDSDTTENKITSTESVVETSKPNDHSCDNTGCSHSTTETAFDGDSRSTDSLVVNKCQPLNPLSVENVSGNVSSSSIPADDALKHCKSRVPNLLNTGTGGTSILPGTIQPITPQSSTYQLRRGRKRKQKVSVGANQLEQCERTNDLISPLQQKAIVVLERLVDCSEGNVPKNSTVNEKKRSPVVDLCQKGQKRAIDDTQEAISISSRPHNPRKHAVSCLTDNISQLQWTPALNEASTSTSFSGPRKVSLLETNSCIMKYLKQKQKETVIQVPYYKEFTSLLPEPPKDNFAQKRNYKRTIRLNPSRIPSAFQSAPIVINSDSEGSCPGDDDKRLESNQRRRKTRKAVCHSKSRDPQVSPCWTERPVEQLTVITSSASSPHTGGHSLFPVVLGKPRLDLQEQRRVYDGSEPRTPIKISSGCMVDSRDPGCSTVLSATNMAATTYYKYYQHHQASLAKAGSLVRDQAQDRLTIMEEDSRLLPYPTSLTESTVMVPAHQQGCCSSQAEQRAVQSPLLPEPTRSTATPADCCDASARNDHRHVEAELALSAEADSSSSSMHYRGNLSGGRLADLDHRSTSISHNLQDSWSRFLSTQVNPVPPETVQLFNEITRLLDNREPIVSVPPAKKAKNS